MYRRGCLTHAQQSFYACIVHAVNQTEVGEVTFLLFGFLGQDVAFESVFALDLSGCRELETLLGTGFGF